jgi:hypothetical protein
MRAALFAIAASALLAQSPPPAGPRITPPTLNVVTPQGVARGATVEMTVEGLNLAGAWAIHFSEPGVAGRILRVKELPDLPDIRLGSNGTPSTIDVGPLPPRNQVTVEVDVDPSAHVGRVSFRLLTPLGASPEGAFLVEPYYGESPDREPNDTPENAFEAFLPTILAGVINRPGDVDHYKFRARAGEELVFFNGAAMLGSQLQPVIRLLDENLNVVREVGYDGLPAARFAHRFEKDGTYFARIGDYESSGRAANFYRIIVGRLPVMTSAYPLGLRRGERKPVALRGFHLGAATVTVKGEPSPRDENAAILRHKSPSGYAFNEVRLAIGDEPEVESSGTNRTAAAAQRVALPVTVNGRIAAPERGLPVENYFRFAARKGQTLVFEVNARRLGSELDSLVEVLDAAGKPIEQATVRAVWDTILVLRDHNADQRGLRIQSWNMLNAGDWVMVGGEILRVEEVPDGPDEDMVVEGFGGLRRAYFGTTTEAHGVDRAVYKVQVHPPGARFAPNGLPLVRLNYRNDDGGPGYGKDSYLTFTASADGDYLVRLRDVRGFGGDDYAYRLTIREPRPDFRLSVAPRNPNVPRGGTIPITVTAFRIDGYDGPIALSIANLPPGVTATTNTIPAGHDSATLLLTAAPGAKLDRPAPLEVIGKASAGGRELAHRANPEDATKLIALAPQADIAMQAVTKVVELEPGETVEVTVAARRQNGFVGRIPVQVRDLPNLVRVTDSGLNGVLVNEDETLRPFRLWALPNAQPIERYIYLSGSVETRSPQQNSIAATEPVLVRVKPKKSVASR